MAYQKAYNFHLVVWLFGFIKKPTTFMSLFGCLALTKSLQPSCGCWLAGLSISLQPSCGCSVGVAYQEAYNLHGGCVQLHPMFRFALGGKEVLNYSEEARFGYLK